jgi:hypothetical protein
VHSTQSSYAAQDTLSFHLMRLVLVSLQRAVSSCGRSDKDSPYGGLLRSGRKVAQCEVLIFSKL